MTDAADLPEPDEGDLELWEDEMLERDDPFTHEDDIPALEEPTEPYDEDNVPLEPHEYLDDLPTGADITPDESEMDHNLPKNRGMPD